MKKINTLLLLGGMSAAANAASVSVDYDFSGATSAPTTVIGDISGSTMTSGAFTGGVAGATHSTFSDSIFVRTNGTGATTANGDSIADAVSNDAYASFTITAGAEDVVLNTITWAHYGTNTNFAGADFSVYAFQQSVGFNAGDEIGFTSTAGAEVAGDTADFSSGALALSGTITAGSTEEFRFYYVDNSTSTTRISKLNSISITGNTVPEPSSAALLGLGGLALILRRRK